METDDVPTCDACGGFVRPDVVMYGENLPGGPFYEAVMAVSMADVMIVGGTSLTVQPAASFVDMFQGEHLIIINRDPTPCDGRAELVIRESVSKVLSAVCH
jgi:NAD-dependent deacetylase